MRYYIQTFGCQMNVYDSDSITGILNEAGHEPTENEEAAELILLNTCSIRENAEERVRGRVGQLKRWKTAGALKHLGICGCMGQKEGKQLLDAIPYLDLVMGPGAIGSAWSANSSRAAGRSSTSPASRMNTTSPIRSVRASLPTLVSYR